MDGDAFFVGVEVAKNPKLKGLPVVTGEERGIVTALSYEAKALGVSRGLPIFQIKKNFPNVLILPGDYASYALYSQKMFDIVRRYADDVDEYSIDECFADLTGLVRPLKMTYREITERIKREVNDELGLSVSLGLAPTKVLAKVASKYVKPNGLTLIPGKRAHEFLAETLINKIWGIGPQTSQLLMRKGIYTALDFANKTEAWITHHSRSGGDEDTEHSRANVLSKPYKEIWQELNCISVFKVDPYAKTTYASIQKTRTFHPSTNDKTFLFSQLSKHLEDACSKARHYKLVPKKVSMFLKTQTFRYHYCEISLLSPTSLPEILLPLMQKEFYKMHKVGIPYRATGVTLRELKGSEHVQGDLFGATDRISKFEAIHEQIDNLEEKFGKRVVYLASTHSALRRKTSGTDAEDLDRDLLFL